MRSRSGCATCRRRHTKCDETKPECRKCARSNLKCPGYSTELVFRDDTAAVSRRADAIETQKWAAIRARDAKAARRRARDRVNSGPKESRNTPQNTQSLGYDASQAEQDGEEEQEEEERMHSPLPTPSPSSASLDAAYILGGLASRSSVVSSHALTPINHDGGGNATAPPHTPGPTLGFNLISVDTPSVHESFCHDSGPGYPAAYTPLALSVGSYETDVSALPDVEDSWLSEHFPQDLPSVFRDVWEGIGYSDRTLKYALLGFLTLSSNQVSDASRREGLWWYSQALSTMAHNLPTFTRITQAGITFAILCLFLHIEITLGTVSGGSHHCKQSDALVTQFIDDLGRWETGRRLVSTWMRIRCVYQFTQIPWRGGPIDPLPPEIVPLLQAILKQSSDRSDQLLLMMHESDQLNQRIVIGRLIGVNATWPSFKPWCRRLERLGMPRPVEDIYRPGTDEARLAAIARDLDTWHDECPMTDLPTCGIRANQDPAFARRRGLAPASFGSHQAAMSYLRYAMAQSMCSVKTLDELTGGELTGNASPEEWDLLILRIIAGMNVEDCSRQDLTEMGIMASIGRLLLRCPLDLKVLDAIEDLLPLLDTFCARFTLTFVPRMFRVLISIHREQLAKGRMVLGIWDDCGPAAEIWNLRTTVVPLNVVLIGRDMKTGSVFQHSLSTSV